MPYIEPTNKKKYPDKDQSFRKLFKKRKTTLILGAFILCSIVFGIGKSLSFITWMIVSSPFIVILWSSFSEQIMSIFKLK